MDRAVRFVPNARSLCFGAGWGRREEFCPTRRERISWVSFMFISLVEFFQLKMYLRSLKRLHTGCINDSLKRRIC